MRPFVFLLILLVLCAAGSPLRADPQVAPRRACSALDTPVILFDPGESEPKQHEGYFRWIVRTARGCRFRRLAIVIYGDEHDELSRGRAKGTAQELSIADWPSESIDTEFRAATASSNGTDFGRTWTAGAEIHFLDPDPSWTPPLQQPVMECPPEPGKCNPIPWPLPRRTAVEPVQLFASLEPRSVFFDSGGAILNDEAQAVLQDLVAQAGHENCAEALVVGYASADEKNPDELAFQRAAAVHDELVRLGIPGQAITVLGHGWPGKPESFPEQRMNRRVQITFGD